MSVKPIQPLLTPSSKENYPAFDNLSTEGIKQAALPSFERRPSLNKKPSLKLRVTGKLNLNLVLPETPRAVPAPPTPKSVRKAKFKPPFLSLQATTPRSSLPTPRIQVHSSDAEEIRPISEEPIVIHTGTVTPLATLSPRDRRLACFVKNPECIITHLTRGAYSAYLVRDIGLRHLLSTNSRIGELIADYTDLKLNIFYNAVSSKKAILKPTDESRGMENARHLQREKHADKAGVPKECASFNEYIPRLLGLLDHAVAITQARSPSFYIRDTITTGIIEKTVVAIQALPGKTLDNIDSSARPSFLQTISQDNYEKMALLDLYLCNTDRNAGNVILDKKKLHPIDHAAILPAGFASHANFIWMNWAQAHTPWSESMQQKIQSLDPSADIQQILREKPDYPEANLEVMEITAHLLKEGTKRGLTPFQLGLFFAADNEGGALLQYMHAEVTSTIDSMQTPEKPTVLELMKARTSYILNHLVANPELMQSLEAWRPGLLCRESKNVLSNETKTT